MRSATPALRARRSTRYEVVAEGNGERVVLGFTARRSLPGLLAVARARADELIEHFNITDDDSGPVQHGRDAFLDFGKARVRFSGRTERESYYEGRASR